MPNQTEPNANNALGDLLRGMLPGSRVVSENTLTFPAHPADVLITAPGRSPVVVEAEYEPAPEAEQDAAQRLGFTVAGESRTIESAIALRYPVSVRDSYDAPGRPEPFSAPLGQLCWGTADPKNGSPDLALCP